MGHPRSRLSVFSRQLWSGASQAGRRRRRRAARHQPRDRVQVGAPVPGRGLAGLADRSSRPRRSPRRWPTRSKARSSPPGPAGAMDPIGWDRCRACRPRRSTGSSPGRLQSPARRRQGDRGPGPLRRLPPGRAGPPGPQEARPDPRRRRLAGARPGPGPPCSRVATSTSRWSSTTPAATRSWFRSPTNRRERSGGARDRGGRVRQGRHPDRAGADRQRVGLPQPRLPGHDRRARRPPQADAALAAPDQRQGRTVHPDPAPRVGVRPSVPVEPRPPPGPRALRRLLQSPATPHRDRRPHPSTLSTTSPDITTSRPCWQRSEYLKWIPGASDPSAFWGLYSRSTLANARLTVSAVVAPALSPLWATLVMMTSVIVMMRWSCLPLPALRTVIVASLMCSPVATPASAPARPCRCGA